MKIKRMRDVALVVSDAQSLENSVDMRISIDDLASNRENAESIPETIPYRRPKHLYLFKGSPGKIFPVIWLYCRILSRSARFMSVM